MWPISFVCFHVFFLDTLGVGSFAPHGSEVTRLRRPYSSPVDGSMETGLTEVSPAQDRKNAASVVIVGVQLGSTATISYFLCPSLWIKAS